MWQSEQLGREEILTTLVEAFQSTVPPGYTGSFDPDDIWPSPYEEFRKRFTDSFGYVLSMKDSVSKFFLKGFKKSPPPPSMRLAVFAPGSASRLELFSATRVAAMSGSRELKKEYESDLDLLCVVDGYDPSNEEWEKTMEEFASHLKDKCDFLLDGMSNPPQTVTRAQLLGYPGRSFKEKERVKLVRKEAKTLETWRYWIVFESVLLYEYPPQKGAIFAGQLESVLARKYFGIDFALQAKRFPLLWYHAACRYMCGIYLDTFRELLKGKEMGGYDIQEGLVIDSNSSKAEEKAVTKMMKKVVKLKTARLLAWCVAMMNALVMHQMADLDSSENDNIWSFARVPGLIPSFYLQNLLYGKVISMATPSKGAVNEASEKVAGLEETFNILQELDKDLRELRRQILYSYAEYFKWIEKSFSFSKVPTISEVYDLMYGNPVACLEFSEDLVKLVVSASRLFHRLVQVAATRRFAPDFLFY